MSAEPATSATPAAATPRRWRWRRIGRWFLGLGLAAAVLLSLAGWHLWSDRTAYAARLLSRYAPELAPSLGALEVSAGAIRLQNLSLHDPATGEAFGGVEEAVLDHWIEALRFRRVGRLRIDGLRISTSAARLPVLLGALPRSAQAIEKAADTGAVAALPLSIEGVEMSNLRIEFTGDERLPSVSFTLDHRFERFEWQSGIPGLASAEFDLRDFQLTTPDGSTLKLPALRVRAAFAAAEGMLRVDEITVAESALELDPGLLAWLASWRPAPDAESGGLPDWFKGVEVRRFALQGLEVKAATGLPGLPQLAVEARLQHEVEDLVWNADTGLRNTGRHQLKLTQTHLRPVDEAVAGHIRLPDLALQFSRGDAGQPWHVENLAAAAPDLHWTAQWEASLLGGGGDSPSQPSASPSPAMPAVRLQALSVTDGRVRVEKTNLVPVDLQTRLDARLAELVLAGSRVESASKQRLRLHEIETQIPGSRTAEPTRIEGVEIELRPDALLGEGRVDRLRISRPRLAYHINFDALAAKSGDTSGAPREPAALPAFVSKLHFDDLAITEGSVRVHGRLGAPFETETSFQLETESSDDNSSFHKLSIAETRLTASESSTPLPVARVGSFEARARLPDLIAERRVESLVLDGGQVEFGDALLSILDPGTPAKVAPDAQPGQPAGRDKSSAKKWRAGSVTVRNLDITLQRVAPGLPPFTFGVQFEAKDTPLEPEGLVENVEPQKVELSSLTIPAPYGSLRPVARLDSIFVHFTLDGLLRRRIGKVEILNPTLYVGEPLFWYVDYYRKFAAGDIKSDSDAPGLVLASAENEVALNAAAAAVSGPPRQAWIVEELQVHSGKIVLAPKGVPLPGFHQPFPFSFTTKLESGQFEAVFDIPSDNYPLPDLKLEFIGMKGQVQFNLPLKDVDNNLTETFTVDQIRWKQLHVEEAYLSVTYDMNGIYGEFGGAAYEGYIKGGFDVFLNDSYTWDGWIAATGVRATEVTEKLTPAYLLLDGKFNGTLIAAGDAKELYQADIDFTSTESGRFSISSLNDMIEKLPPPNTAALTDQFTRIGLETLRDFEYDTVRAKGRLHGREGSGFLNIAGPQGSRNIEVNVLDHRWKVDKPEAGSD